MSWWDYGYWITRMAHRIPNANPSQDPRAVTSTANYFISQNETAANEIATQLGTAYVVIDYDTSISKFWAMAVWAGRQDTEFMEDYVVQQQSGPTLVRLFYPEYYRSLSTRLYNFDGKAVTPATTYVITYQEKTSQLPYRQVTNVQQFTTYQDAAAFVASNQGNYKIVGINPFVSPVPLEQVEHYKVAFSSNQTTTAPNSGDVPSVKIFQYSK
jgi:dolichyl-diphosphooligosaccharide--protein glycosyltransferase